MTKIIRTKLSNFMKIRLVTYLPIFLIGFCLIGLGIYADKLNTQSQEHELYQSVLDQLSIIRARLEGNINSNAQSVKGLVAAISIEPNMTQERFAALAKPLFQGQTQLRNIGAAPDLVIRYMFPVQGNEAAIGLNYRNVPAQYDAAKKAIDTGKLIISGPINLVQGNQGFIANIPVFIHDEATGKSNLWGVISAVLDTENLYAASGLHDSKQKIEISIRGKDALGKQGHIFFGRDEVFTLEPVLLDVVLPYGSWQLAAIPKGGWSNHLSDTGIFRAAIFLIGLMILIPLFFLSSFMEKKRESETLLRGLFELSSVGIALNDYATGKFINVNDALLSPTGYTRKEFMELSYWDLTPKEYEAQEILQLESMEKTNRYGPYNKEYLRKDGSRYPLLLNGIVVYNSYGKKMIWSIVEDISKRVEAESALISARDEANHANKAKSQFLSSMSHELRTPLNAILGFAQLITLDEKDSLKKQNINEIINAGDHLLKLINEVLDLSKIESGNVKLNIGSHSFKKIFNNALVMIGPLADNDNHAIQIMSSLPDINVTVDEVRFKQVLLNILSNAIKYNSENGKVVIDCSTTDEKMLLISVTDSGKGLTPEQQSNLFTPFERLGAENSHIEGTGLGLVISKELIELMGGKMGVESVVGKGSRFWIQVPIA